MRSYVPRTYAARVARARLEGVGLPARARLHPRPRVSREPPSLPLPQARRPWSRSVVRRDEDPRVSDRSTVVSAILLHLDPGPPRNARCSSIRRPPSIPPSQTPSRTSTSISPCPATSTPDFSARRRIPRHRLQRPSRHPADPFAVPHPSPVLAPRRSCSAFARRPRNLQSLTAPPRLLPPEPLWMPFRRRCCQHSPPVIASRSRSHPPGPREAPSNAR